MVVVLSVLLLIISTFWVYQPVGTFGFMSMDDPEYVGSNIHVQRGLSPAEVAWAFRSFRMGYWIPLTWLSFMAEVELFGFSPGVFHLGNLCLHIACGLLLLLTLAKMTGRWWLPFAVALLFALHPLHVESVAWITERKDVLSTLFWALGLWSYVRYVRAPSLVRYLAVASFLVLGLMAKPMLVTFPVTLLLLDFWPLGRFHAAQSAEPAVPGFPRLGTRSSIVAEKVPLFLISAVFGALAFYTQLAAGGVKSTSQVPLSFRAANATYSTALYLVKGLWPADLAVFYPHPGPSISPGKVLVAALVLCALSVLFVALRRRQPPLLTGWLWYLATLFPVSGVLQSGAHGMADRFLYVPGIGLLVAAVWGVGGAPLPGRSRRLSLAAAAALVASAFAAAASGQVRHWRTDIELLTHALRSAGPSAFVLEHLGFAHWRDGRTREAIELYQQGLAIDPASPWLHNFMGVALQRQGQLENARQHFARAVELAPGLPQSLGNLAILLEGEGRHEEARRLYERAVAADPEQTEAHFNLGLLLYRTGDLAGARRSVARALAISPADADAHRLLGAIALAQGDLPQAISSLGQATRLDPAHAEARYQLGLAMLKAGDAPSAAQAFRETLRLKPDHAGARRQLEKMQLP